MRSRQQIKTQRSRRWSSALQTGLPTGPSANQAQSTCRHHSRREQGSSFLSPTAELAARAPWNLRRFGRDHRSKAGNCVSHRQHRMKSEHSLQERMVVFTQPGIDSQDQLGIQILRGKTHRRNRITESWRKVCHGGLNRKKETARASLCETLVWFLPPNPAAGVHLRARQNPSLHQPKATANRSRDESLPLWVGQPWHCGKAAAAKAGIPQNGPQVCRTCSMHELWARTKALRVNACRPHRNCGMSVRMAQQFSLLRPRSSLPKRTGKGICPTEKQPFL